MAQLSPTTIYLAQAARLISVLQRQYGILQFKSQDEIVELFNKALTDFQEKAGKSLTDYEPVYKSEPPSSTKMNRFWANLSTDISILDEQVELLRAAAIDLFNSVTVEIKKAENSSLQAQNKLKTLELYSNVSDPSLIFFGDNFINDEYIDWDAMSPSENRALLLGHGMVGLGVENVENVLDNTSPKIRILEGSNGFLGNNQELLALPVTTVAPGEPSPDTTVNRFFKHSFKNPNDTDMLIDGKPETWIEFEKYWIDPAEANAAQNFNFDYKFVDKEEWQYLKPFVKANSTVSWADGFNALGTGSLVLNLEIDLKSPKRVNLIELLPFGLEDNINNPILIKTVQVSLDKTVWFTLYPKSTYLANSIDRRVLDIDAYHIYVGKGVWAAPGEQVRFVRFEIVQEQPISSEIGHHYYIAKDSQTSTRVLGPIPPVDETSLYTSSRNLGNADIVQHIEAIPGKRWAIGIRDINVSSNVYYETSTFVSKRFEAGGVIDRVAVDAEVEIPAHYDSSHNWVKFYVSPDNGNQWFPISRIQDDFLGIPEIIAFNDPTPVAMREPGVAYHEVSQAVTSIRLKVELTRPTQDEYTTPILHPYKIKIKRRV